MDLSKEDFESYLEAVEVGIKQATMALFIDEAKKKVLKEKIKTFAKSSEK
jgi:hypothetical protein